MADDMRKVIFTIDDLAWMQKHYNLTDEQMKDIFANQESFKAIYTLYGEGNNTE